MNRRSFLTRLAKAVAVTVAAPTILPAATTYVRSRWALTTSGRIFVNVAGCGLLTRCNVVVPTSAELETIFGRRDPIYMAAMESLLKAHPHFEQFRLPAPSFYDFVMNRA